MDALVDVCGEEQVASPRLPYDLLQSGLVNRQLELGAVPRIDTRLVEVDDGDANVGALERDDSAGRTT